MRKVSTKLFGHAMSFTPLNAICSMAFLEIVPLVLARIISYAWRISA